jgi:hypothetical protein
MPRNMESRNPTDLECPSGSAVDDQTGAILEALENLKSDSQEDDAETETKYEPLVYGTPRDINGGARFHVAGKGF